MEERVGFVLSCDPAARTCLVRWLAPFPAPGAAVGGAGAGASVIWRQRPAPSEPVTVSVYVASRIAVGGGVGGANARYVRAFFWGGAGTR